MPDLPSFTVISTIEPSPNAEEVLYLMDDRGTPLTSIMDDLFKNPMPSTVRTFLLLDAEPITGRSGACAIVLVNALRALARPELVIFAATAAIGTVVETMRCLAWAGVR